MSAVQTLSGGEGSWRSAKLWKVHRPDQPLRMVFTDTLYEDADTYRFLIQSAADLVGRRLNWTVRASDFPDYRAPADQPIEEYAGNPEWRAFLADLRERTMEAIPELTWLVEGRDPWEIYRDSRFLGNSSFDPCSRIAKREVLEKWRDSTLDPATDVLLYGIGEDESHRFDRTDKDGQRRGIKPRLEALGWTCHAPLIEFDAHPIKDVRSDVYGIPQQRLYALGYFHGNCGGFCCKAGMVHWRNRHRVQRDRYEYDALMERKIQTFLGSDVTILGDRANAKVLATGARKKKPLSLYEFAAKLELQPEMDFAIDPGDSGCGCMVDE